MDKEEEWKKACQAERNFQKAVDTATGFIKIKNEKDRQFMVKWLYICEKQKKTQKSKQSLMQ